MFVSYHLGSKTTLALEKQKVINPGHYEEYTYCFEYLYDLVIFNISLLAIGALLHDIFASIIYIFCMSALKAVAGGYHARKRLTCSILSYSIYLSVFALYKSLSTMSFISNSTYMLCGDMIYLIISLIVMCLSPVGNHNKTFSNEERKKLKTLSAILLAAISVLYLAMRVRNTFPYSYLIIICLLIILVNQMVGIYSSNENKPKPDSKGV